MKPLGLEIRFPASETPSGFKKHDFWTIFGSKKRKCPNFEPGMIPTIPGGSEGSGAVSGDVKNSVRTRNRWLHPGF